LLIRADNDLIVFFIDPSAGYESFCFFLPSERPGTKQDADSVSDISASFRAFPREMFSKIQ